MEMVCSIGKKKYVYKYKILFWSAAVCLHFCLLICLHFCSSVYFSVQQQLDPWPTQQQQQPQQQLTRRNNGGYGR